MKQCESCSNKFNPFETQNPKAGLGEEGNAMYAQRRMAGVKLCDQCLNNDVIKDLNKRAEELRQNKTPHD